MSVDVAAQRGCWPAIGHLRVTVEISQQLVQPSITRITIGLFGMQIAGQYVYCVDCCHAVPLAHQPAAGGASQAVECQISRIGWHHIQGSAGVSLGSGLEVFCRQRRAVSPATLGIRHMHHQPHAGACQVVQSNQFVVHALQIWLHAIL